MASPRRFPPPAAAVFDLVDARSLDGLIVWSSVLNWFIEPAEMLRFCTRYGLPTITAEVSIEGFPSVSIDDYGGMHAAVSHLIEVHGYRRIAFQRGGDQHAGMHERYRGYVDALAEHGLALDPNLVTPPTTWDGRQDMKVLLDERGLRPHVDFEALVCSADGLLRGVHVLFAEREIRIPGDVAVVGFDNTFEMGIFTPPYTSVDPQFYDVGRRAVELLLALLRGEDVPERVTVPARLAIRQSCGCLAHLAPGIAASPARRAGSVPQAVEESVPAIFAARREEILVDLAHRLGDGGDDAARVLDAFCAGVDRATATIFLEQLDQALRHAQTASEVVAWYAALTVLRS